MTQVPTVCTGKDSQAASACRRRLKREGKSHVARSLREYSMSRAACPEHANMVKLFRWT